ncbi:MAG: class I SAM-dependent methyltransferase [Bacteroidia bacterium]|nr:class I SAM-dependent methyltransferase [Bacteroidia bacterium]MDW8236525.1 class I SAM-dependent methyltransferase [Bacteroidia bacterium]
MEYQVLYANWKDYKLIDFGEGWRWEQWGPISLQRPDPRALGRPAQALATWKAQHRYQATGSYTGEWEPPLPEKWEIRYPGKGWTLRLWVRSGKFKHLGVFPEQAPHWEWLYSALLQWPGAPVLNLFAYTGVTSITAAIAGAQVIHIDASKSAITWAAENAQLNGISTIRWIPEDARLFVQRAARREKKYRAILLDPPAYGTGPQGKRWKLEKDLPSLLQHLPTLLSPEAGLFLLNIYSADFFFPYMLYQLIRQVLPERAFIEIGELTLRAEDGRELSTGMFVRGIW